MDLAVPAHLARVGQLPIRSRKIEGSFELGAVEFGQRGVATAQIELKLVARCRDFDHPL